MTTEVELFFELLHKARELKRRNIDTLISKAILLGMKWAFIEHLEDLNIADNMRDYWRCQQSGQEPIE